METVTIYEHIAIFGKINITAISVEKKPKSYKLPDGCLLKESDIGKIKESKTVYLKEQNAEQYKDIIKESLIKRIEMLEKSIKQCRTRYEELDSYKTVYLDY